MQTSSIITINKWQMWKKKNPQADQKIIQNL